MQWTRSRGREIGREEGERDGEGEDVDCCCCCAAAAVMLGGGIAYVLDVDNKLYKNINKAMISIEKVENKYDKKELRDLIEAHVAATGSKLGTKVLDDFDYYLPHFKKLIPNEYKKMITLSAKLEEKGLTSEQAQMEAFYESIGAKH